MPEPEAVEILDESAAIDEQSEPPIINLAAVAVARAAYWQGVAEERNRMIEQLEATIADLNEDRDATLDYLKDRLGRAESPLSAT